MKKPGHLIILVGIAAATGAAAGMLSNRRNPKMGGLMGAAIGGIAGAFSAKLYTCIAEEDGISYYTTSSPLYKDFNDTEHIGFMP